MEGSYGSVGLRPPRLLAALLSIVLVAALGCAAPEPPLSPGAATFKKEVQECLQQLTPVLAEPLFRADIPDIDRNLEKVEPQTVKLCRMCPFRIAVLNPQGETLTIFPFKQDVMADFSSYGLVQEVLKSRKIVQKRFFLQDGSQLYIICAPVLRQEAVVGLVALGLDPVEARQRWNIAEPELLRLDFNR